MHINHVHATKFIFLLTLLTIPFGAFADGIDSLKAFYQNTSSIRAQFHQTVVDGQGRKLQEVDGSMQLQRPGKFRWDYNKPFVQQIVGDGEKVWLFDPDLNQVTVRSIGKALGSSPAALLAGGKDMDKAETSGRMMNAIGAPPCALVTDVMLAIAVGVAPSVTPTKPAVSTAAS